MEMVALVRAKMFLFATPMKMGRNGKWWIVSSAVDEATQLLCNGATARMLPTGVNFQTLLTTYRHEHITRSGKGLTWYPIDNSGY